jgi:hypothetical protein
MASHLTSRSICRRSDQQNRIGLKLTSDLVELPAGGVAAINKTASD